MADNQTPDPFDGRPLVGSAELRALLPCGRTTFYPLIHSPGFPVALRLADSGDYVWWASEVRAWLESRRTTALVTASAVRACEQGSTGDDSPTGALQPVRSRTGRATATPAVPARGDVVLRPAAPRRRRRTT